MLKIETGLETRALKVVIYGAEGIGKSTFASQFPNPLFLDTEGGTSSLNVRRVKCGKDWSYLLSCVDEVIKDPSICKTLVIDTADGYPFQMSGPAQLCSVANDGTWKNIDKGVTPDIPLNETQFYDDAALVSAIASAS